MIKIKKASARYFFYCLLLTPLAFLCFSAVHAFADIIIDNDDPGTSHTGTWEVSGGTAPYGGDSLWARDGATYTWQFDSQQASGTYEVLMWWSEWPSRGTDIAVDINYRGGNETATINQQENAGQWNSLGQYYFDSSGSVMITAAYGSSVSTCADAVWFKLISENTPPTAYIDSITPNPAEPGQPIEFTGGGIDVEGTIKAYQWESSLDGPLSNLASFTTSSLTLGIHTIFFKVQDNEDIWSEPATQVLVVGSIPIEIIIDNQDAETSQIGTWNVSGAANPYDPDDPDADSVYSRDGSTFSWHFTPPQTGVYQLSMWWTEWSSRSTSVPIDIEHSGETTTVYVNQQQSGGQWNSIGEYYFESGTSYEITITAQPGPSSTCADAVKFNLLDEPAVTITFPDSYYLQGPLDLSVRADAANLEAGWGIKFVLDIGTADEESIPDTTEPYEVVFTGLTRSEHTLDAFVVDNSSTEVPGLYTHDQKIQIGIGDYYVAIGNSITEGYGDDDPSDDTSQDGRNSGGGYEPVLNDLLTTQKGVPHHILNESVSDTTSADGVSSIQTILARHPEARGFLVQYGTNDARPWLPVPSGKGLNPGDPEYPETFKDNMQQIIDTINDAGKEVCIAKPPIALADSTVTDPYEDPDQGARSLLIKEYNKVIDELLMDPFNNIVVAPPDFYSYFNYYDSVTDRYRYEDEYIDNLHPNGIGYHSMAGRWLESLTQTKAVIASITPNPAVIDENVTFTGYGRDPDGSITGYSWESSIDGWLSDLPSFTAPSLSEGTHTISFQVQDSEDNWSEPATQILVVEAVSTEIIIDNRDAQTSQTGTWSVSGAANPYDPNDPDADSLYSRDGSTFSWHFTPPQTGVYQLSMWWTEWSSRSTSVPVDIEHSGETTTVYVNQQQSGGQWNSAGNYYFESGSSYNVTVTAQPGPSSTCADAVKFNFIQSNDLPTAIIDSITPNPADVGESVTFTGHGEDSDGTVEGCSWDSSLDGDLGNELSFSTGSLSEGEHVISFRVQDNEGEWSAPASQTLIVGNIPPVAYVDSISPNPADIGESVTFTGHGEDPDGSIAGYSWNSSIDGALSDADSFSTSALSPGIHTITFTVYDDDGAASETASQTITLQVVTDNGDPGTSYTGTWSISGGSDPYGTDSLYSLDGATYTWTFSPTISGYYEVAMWWTDWPSRSTNVPVDIEHSEGIATVYINQRQNGGQWNTLGAYLFESGLNYSVTITAQPGPSSTCADAVRFVKVPAPENIYACFAYGPGNAEPGFISFLQDIGAYQAGDVWIYRNEQNKNFNIHLVHDIEHMRQALYTEGAHILLQGHSNYGLGPIFATEDEIRNQLIEDVFYIDDDRIFNYSSPWIHVRLSGMRTGQAYPYWWPIFKDGTSGIMPYDFGDPRGDPPYNYYITYQVPGDQTFYKVETAHNSAVERFPGCDRPAWYAPDGATPDPTDPDHLQYYITNPEPWYPSFESIGDWTQSQVVAGYFKENYLYTSAGQGDNEVRWVFRITEPGNYKVSSWWPASEEGCPNAPYTINHAFGDETILVDQRVNGNQWNEIGEFYYDAGEYSVILTDDAGTGNVVADAVRMVHVDNPPELVQADFYASAKYRNGPAPLQVEFNNQSTGDFTDRLWDFGDGHTNSTRESITHGYTQPGTYTVSLTVSGPSGSDTKTKVDYITVGNTTASLQAEFSSDSHVGTTPLKVIFSDRSSGDIASRFWDFGDGHTSIEKNPEHTYSTPGYYTVSLTVVDINGNSITETKDNFVAAMIFYKAADNVDYPKTHFGTKTILFRKELEIDKEELKYDRLFLLSCNTGNYYMHTFNRGIYFYDLSSTWVGVIPGWTEYLKAYFEGKTDEEIWEILQSYDPVFDYYDFSKFPWEQGS